MRVTLSAGHRAAVLALLGDLLGPAEPCPGRHTYAEGVRFACGASVLWDEPGRERATGSLLVELKGKTIAVVGQDELARVALELQQLGGRCRRLDVRCDFRGARAVGLIESIEASCRADELRHARRWRPVEDHDGAELVGRGVYLGRRGSEGSGRFVRVYDKGLETGEFPSGNWVRWELEASDAVAVELFNSWCDDSRRTPGERRGPALLAAAALGAVDFRTAGRLDRSERVTWWAAFLDGLDVQLCRARRAVSSLVGFVKHVRRTIAPTLAAFAAAAGRSVSSVLDELGVLVDVKPARSSKLAVREFLTAAAAPVVDREPPPWRFGLLDVMRENGLCSGGLFA